MADLGEHRRLRLFEDSSAAKGIADRTGLGKVRHIEVNQLWIQEKVRDKEIEINRVKGIENTADALTKHVDGEDIAKHLKGVNCYIGTGRHPEMPLTAAESGKDTPGHMQSTNRPATVDCLALFLSVQ